jgi:hypothetical protein
VGISLVGHVRRGERNREARVIFEAERRLQEVGCHRNIWRRKNWSIGSTSSQKSS